MKRRTLFFVLNRNKPWMWVQKVIMIIILFKYWYTKQEAGPLNMNFVKNNQSFHKPLHTQIYPQNYCNYKVS